MAKIREKIDLVGKLETLQSLVAENHSSNGIIKKYISSFKFRNDVDTISLVGHMLREFKSYDWVETINEFCTTITNDVKEHEIELALESTLYSLKRENRFNSYDKTIKVLEGLMNEETIDTDKLRVALQESTWIPTVKSFVSLVENKISAPKTDNIDVHVSKVYSPVDVVVEGETESYLFHMNGKVYESVENELKVSNKKPSAIFNKLLSVCEAFDIVENTFKMTHKKHTIEITVNESIETKIDGKVVEAENVASTLSATGAFYVNEMAKLDLIVFASQNADKIQEMDFATSIKSRVYEGVVTNIIKLDESVYVNTINTSMMKNDLVKAESGSEAVKMVKESVNYDASNIVKDILEGEEKFAQQIEESKKLIEERINFLNEQLGDVYAAEKEFGNSETLDEAKTIIKESLDTEKANLSTLLNTK